ncbi:nitrite/sulfite reductase [Nitrolancea hollandica]|uniref:Putative Sulfite reductase n=1 Tax=Nitrolancea hollandica Lb TaxID=1129897 RepID=I4EHC2_9BACT|nr:nitrite/sulfite reductase [Nitrolancea hollandica]CCF84084.1 putative Sulfite reductase [Nitrolancea hollandica Lb]
MPPTPTWDLVLKRNSIERLKREKFPFAVLDELPELIERGYEDISEEDIVRFQWYGLYHDKPKVGYFMMRVKIPSGILTTKQLRTIGELSRRIGRNDGELTTRQNIQLHWIKLEHLPEIFPILEKAGLSVLGGCGDAVRNITGCPVAGIDREEVFDCTPLVDEAAKFFYGHREYSDLPRKHKITISTCAYHCNAPAINCIVLIGAIKDGRRGYAIRLGGGLSSAPRVARAIDAWVPEEEAMEVLRAILDAWRFNLQYRMSRAKARMKFMMDDFGPEGFRAEIERYLGRKMEDFPSPRRIGDTEHLGINAQKKEGLYYIGFPVYLGRISGDQMVALADIAESVGGDIRLTRQQNFIVGNVPEAEVDRVVREVGDLGFPLDVSRLRGTSQGCTGSPLCNYAVAETKVKLDEIVQHLEATFGREADGIIVNVDGCPHACAHHWTADIGLQGSTLRDKTGAGQKLEAYEIYLRGTLGEDAEIGRPIVRRVPADDAKFFVERLIRAYLERRQPGEPFKGFADRTSDEELIAIASDRPLEEVEAEFKAAQSRRGGRAAAAAAAD